MTGSKNNAWEVNYTSIRIYFGVVWLARPATKSTVGIIINSIGATPAARHKDSVMISANVFLGILSARIVWRLLRGAIRQLFWLIMKHKLQGLLIMIVKIIRIIRTFLLLFKILYFLWLLLYLYEKFIWWTFSFFILFFKYLLI